MIVTMIVRYVVVKPVLKMSTRSLTTHTLVFKLLCLLSPVADEILSRLGSCQEDKNDGAWPTFAALIPARSLVASSIFGPEE